MGHSLVSFAYYAAALITGLAVGFLALRSTGLCLPRTGPIAAGLAARLIALTVAEDDCSGAATRAGTAVGSSPTTGNLYMGAPNSSNAGAIIAGAATFTNTTVSGSNLARTATLVVCASDAKETGQCDYLADGKDDQVEIQAAIRALPPAGGSVVLSDGSFRLSAPVNAAGNLVLQGQGRSTRLLQYYQATRGRLGMIYLPEGVDSVTIRDLVLDGRIGEAPKAEGWWYHSGIGTPHSNGRVVGNSNVTISGVWFRKMERGISAYNGSGWQILNNVCEDCQAKDGAIDVDHGNKPGGAWTHSGVTRYNLVSGNYVYGSTTVSPLCVDGPDAYGHSIATIVTENWFVAPSWSNIIIQGQNVTFSNNYVSADPATGAYIALHGTGHIVANNTLRWVHIRSDGTHIRITGNDIANAKQGSQDGLKIWLEPGAGDTLIANNILSGHQRAAVQTAVGVSAPRVTLLGNLYVGHGGLTWAKGDDWIVQGNRIFAREVPTSLSVAASSGDTAINIADVTNALPGVKIAVVQDSGTLTTYIKERIGQNWVLLADALTGAAKAGNAVTVGAAGGGVGLLSGSNRWMVTGNNFTDVGGAKLSDSGTSTIVRQNVGYVTEASGAATIDGAATSVTVAHGLSVTPGPGDCVATAAENPANDVGVLWIDTYSHTQLNINVERPPGASDLDVVWSCAVY